MTYDHLLFKINLKKLIITNAHTIMLKIWIKNYWHY